MSDLAIGQPPYSTLLLRRLEVNLTEGTERFRAFVGFPRSGGMIFACPSKEGKGFHYHFLIKKHPGSNSWKMALIQTWEPSVGIPKHHEEIWSTPPVTEDDLMQWGQAVLRYLQSIESLFTGLQASGFGLASHAWLEQQGWVPFTMITTILKKAAMKKRVAVSNADVAALMAVQEQGLPDVMMLATGDQGDFAGLAFRMTNAPRPEELEKIGANGDPSAPRGSWYMFCRTEVLHFIADLFITTGLKSLKDKGLRERLQQISEALQAHRAGMKVDWRELLSW